MGGVASACKRVFKTVTRVFKRVFRAVRRVVRRVANTVRRFYKKYIKPVIRKVHNFVKKCYRTVKRVVTKIKNAVKKVVKTVVKKVSSFVRNTYRKYIKPWLKPIIDKVKKYVPIVNVISNGYKLIKNGYKFIKNSFKAVKNYFTGGNYRKYTNKLIQYGKSVFNNAVKAFKNSTVLGNIINIGERVYNIGKRIYNYCNTTYNFVKTGYNYYDNYRKGIKNKNIMKKLNKIWKSNSNLLPKIPFISNKIINRINSITSKYEKGKNIYKNAKEKIINYKKNIHNYEKKFTSHINELNKYKNKFGEIINLIKEKKNLCEQLLKKREENANFSCEIIVEKVRREYATRPLNYCSRCCVPCCQVCPWPDDSPYSQCSYFNGGRTCPRCPGKCPREAHIKKYYIDVRYKEKETVIIEEKKRIYYEACSQISYLENEIKSLESKLTRFKSDSTYIIKKIQKSMDLLDNNNIKHEEFYSFNSFRNLLSDAESQKKLILGQMKEIVNKTNFNDLF